MRHAGQSRVAVAAVLTAITLALTTGCSISIGDAKKKEPTVSEEAAAQEDAATGQPTAGEKLAGESSTAPENTGVSQGGAVHRARVAQTISDKLVEIRGKRPDRVTCPAHLPARVGATIRCELTAGSDTLGVSVTALSVTGNRVNFDFKVDDAVG